MASSTSSAIAAQQAPEQSLDETAIQLSQDSAAEGAKATIDTSKLPNSHSTAQHTTCDPQPDARQSNADEEDDRPAPFPLYREPDEADVHEAVQSLGHDPLGISVQADPTPLPAADGGAPQPQSTPDVGQRLPKPIAETASEPTSETPFDLLSSPTHIPEQTPEQASEPAPEVAHEPEPFVQPTPNSPLASPPAPPPPYWTHSRDGSQGHNSQNNNTSIDAGRPATAAVVTGRTNAATSFFSAPFLRRLDSSSRSQGTAPSASSATQWPSTGTTQTSSTHIGSRGTGNGKSYFQGHHRRDTSSSTLDLNVNLITLQDNEAEDDDGYRNDSGWQYNGAPADSGAPPSSSALSSPTTSSLLSPGPPPGSAGSSNTSHGGNSSPLTATRTISNTPKNTNYNRCWARRVDITDHVVIGAGNTSSSGGGGLFPGFSSSHSTAHPRLGAFVVWTIRVQTLEGSSGNTPQSPNSSSTGHSFCVYKRYSEFDTLRRRLVASFPQARGGGALPPLPPKSVLGKFRPAFLEQRRLGLQYFLNCILLNPEFAGSPVLQEFLFS